jgi:hypothetical protein
VRGRKSRVEWRAIIRDFEQSGQSHEAFCTARRLNVGSFRAWLYGIPAEPSAGVRLLPVAISTAGASSPAVAPPTSALAVVIIVGAVKVRVPIGPVPCTLAAWSASSAGADPSIECPGVPGGATR